MNSLILGTYIEPLPETSQKRPPQQRVKKSLKDERNFTGWATSKEQLKWAVIPNVQPTRVN